MIKLQKKNSVTTSMRMLFVGVDLPILYEQFKNKVEVKIESATS